MATESKERNGFFIGLLVEDKTIGVIAYNHTAKIVI